MEPLVIIIIGLPCSGKSILSNDYNSDYKIYDDFIFEYFNGKLINDIKNGIKVCINDPRLCNITIFNRYINDIIKFVSKDKIKLILYKNEKNKCIKNMNNRKDNKQVDKMIEYLSNIYDPNNYKDYNSEIINVYQ